MNHWIRLWREFLLSTNVMYNTWQLQFKNSRNLNITNLWSSEVDRSQLEMKKTLNYNSHLEKPEPWNKTRERNSYPLVFNYGLKRA
jgi:hypothetical protein